MGGKSYIFSGARGMGKSHMMKEIYKSAPRRNLFLYDVNKEYTEFYNKPLVPFTEFMDMATSLQNAIVGFDEATIFLNNRSCNSKFVEFLVRLRHTNNTALMAFHSLRAVPRYIFDLCTHLVLFKTGDNISLVESRFENDDLTKAFLQIQKSPMITAKNGKKYSPCKIVSLQDFNPQT